MGSTWSIEPKSIREKIEKMGKKVNVFGWPYLDVWDILKIDTSFWDKFGFSKTSIEKYSYQDVKKWIPILEKKLQEIEKLKGKFPVKVSEPQRTNYPYERSYAECIGDLQRFIDLFKTVVEYKASIELTY